MSNGFLKEPLVHFIAIGSILFGLVSWWQAPDSLQSDNTIRVDEKTLLRFFQYQSGNTDSKKAAFILAAMSEIQRQQVIDAFVREEVLFREGLALNLDQNDRAIRQRLIQKTKFALEAFAVEAAVPEPAELEAFFVARQTDYAVATVISFSHVFFSNEKWGAEKAAALAGKALEKLQGSATHTAGLGVGDRFIYHRNYVQRSEEEVTGHFGERMAKNLFALPEAVPGWQGPLQSDYGSHLVFVTEKQPGYMPELGEIREQVVSDFLFRRQQQQLNNAVKELVDSYHVEVLYQPPVEDLANLSGSTR